MDDGAEVAVQRGRALLDLGRAREAEAQFRLALAADPSDPVAHTLLAQALLRQEKYSEARDASRTALAAAPEHVLAHSTLAAALAGLGEHAAALDAVRGGLALAPEVAGLHLQEACVLLAQKRNAEALAGAERARALDPDSADAAAVHAAALYESQRLDEADAAVLEALRLDPQNIDAHRVRGLLALRRGGGRSAVRAHRTAMRLDPTDAGIREGLSVALKSRNPLYGLLLRLSLWLNAQPKALRWGFLLLPFVLTRLLRPFDGQTWALVLLVLVVALVLLSWTLEPLMNLVLLCTRDRHLLRRAARQATYGFVGLGGAAIAVAVVGTAGGPPRLLGLAFGLGLWAMAVGSAHTIGAKPRRVLVTASWVAAAVAVFAFAGTLAGLGGAVPAVTVLFLGGIAATWFTVLS
ncbi:hypothetical protein SUDANB95_04712 [Actinosynnema sp. ALI-1.44]